MPVLIQSMSEKLFDISAKKLTFRCKEDEIFFEDQKKDRKFTIGCIDVKDNIRIKHNQERKERDIKKVDHSKNVCDTGFPEEISDNESPSISDSAWTPPALSQRQINRKKGSDVTLKLNKRQWLQTVSAIADKTVTSDRTAVQLAVASVSASDNAKELSFSVSTMRRKRQKVRAAIADVVKEGVAQELRNGHKYILHWDEKLLKGRRRVDGSREYMAVVLTNVLTGGEYAC